VRPAAVLLALLLSGCVEPRAWLHQPIGIYPPSAAVLNGEGMYLFGIRARF
jgi:hypothetical protein